MESDSNLPPLDEITDEQLLEAATIFDTIDYDNPEKDGAEVIFQTKDYADYLRMTPEERRKDTIDRVRITRKKEANSAFNLYTIIGTFQQPMDTYFNTLMDMKYYKEYDGNLVENGPIGRSPTGKTETWYWQVKYPRPLSNRDYLFKQRGALVEPTKSAQDEAAELAAHSAAQPSAEAGSAQAKGVIRRRSYLDDRGLAPDNAIAVRMAAAPKNAYGSGRESAKARKGVVRVEEYVTTTAIRSRGEHGCEFVMLYKEDPRGYIPAFVFNWAAKVAIPTSLKLMQSAMDKYGEYTNRMRAEVAAYRTPWERMLTSNSEEGCPYVQLKSPPRSKPSDAGMVAGGPGAEANGHKHGSNGHGSSLSHRMSAPASVASSAPQPLLSGGSSNGYGNGHESGNDGGNGRNFVRAQTELQGNGTTTFAGSKSSMLSTMTSPSEYQPPGDGKDGLAQLQLGRHTSCPEFGDDSVRTGLRTDLGVSSTAVASSPSGLKQMTGWLYIRGKRLGLMRRYFCVADACRFRYYYDDTRSRMKNEVDVIALRSWDGKGNLYGHYEDTFAFDTSQGRFYLVQCESTDSKNMWVKFLTEALENSDNGHGISGTVEFGGIGHNTRAYSPATDGLIDDSDESPQLRKRLGEGVVLSAGDLRRSVSDQPQTSPQGAYRKVIVLNPSPTSRESLPGSSAPVASSSAGSTAADVNAAGGSDTTSATKKDTPVAQGAADRADTSISPKVVRGWSGLPLFVLLLVTFSAGILTGAFLAVAPQEEARSDL